MTQDDFETKFAPIFALKAAAGFISPEAKPPKIAREAAKLGGLDGRIAISAFEVFRHRPAPR